MKQVIRSALIWLVLSGLGHLPLAQWMGTAQSHDGDLTRLFLGLLRGTKIEQSGVGN